MWTVEGQISTAGTFREIWRSGRIAADVSQVEMADLIPSSCERKGVHYPHYCPFHTPPPNIPPSSVAVSSDGCCVAASGAEAAVCMREAWGKEGNQSSNDAIRKFEEEISICCLTAGHRLVADLFCFSYQACGCDICQGTVECGKEISQNNVIAGAK